MHHVHEITLFQKFNVKTSKWNFGGVRSHKPRSEYELSEYVLPNLIAMSLKYIDSLLEWLCLKYPIKHLICFID